MRKVCFLLLAAGLIFSLAACALPVRQGDGTEGSSETASATGETEIPTASTENSAEPTDTQPAETGPETEKRYYCIEETITYSDGTGSLLVRTFDEKGNKLTENSTFADGSPKFQVTYTYDEAGNMLSEQSIYAVDNTGYLSTNTYDDSGRLIRNVYEGIGGERLKNVTEYTYNEDGMLTKEVRTETDGMRNEYTYTYDNKGNLQRKDRKVINKKGVVIQTAYERYIYNKQGNKQTWWDNRGFKKEWTYDDRGNMLSETEKDTNGYVTVGMVYTYDEQNRLLTEGWFKDRASAIMATYVYEYDEAGRKTARYVCENPADISTARADIKYTYDEFGNLLLEEESGRRKEYKYIAIQLPKE